ncbi:putative peptidyl-prolyl cis-trans isomerase [compost metagenome]
MNKKYFVVPLMLLISAALLLGGCGNNNKTAVQEPVQKPAAEPTPESKTFMSWDTPPAMEIDTNKSYKAEVTTNKGNFTIELFAKDAPKTVNNFVFLSRQGFYNDVIFHRIIESFMIQSGDPEGTGMGGPGYRFEDEKTDYQYEPGIVAMANAGPDTNGSQFFICTGNDSVSLNYTPKYTIFGTITDGMDVVKAIAATPVEVGPSGESTFPTETIQIKEIKIIEK